MTKIKIITVRTLKMLELNIFLKSSDKPNISTREKHQEIINTNFPILKATLMPQIPSSIPKPYSKTFPFFRTGWTTLNQGGLDR